MEQYMSTPPPAGLNTLPHSNSVPETSICPVANVASKSAPESAENLTAAARAKQILERLEVVRAQTALCAPTTDERRREWSEHGRRAEKATTLRLTLELPHNYRLYSQPYRDLGKLSNDIYYFANGLKQQLAHVQRKATHPGDLEFCAKTFEKDTNAILSGIDLLAEMAIHRCQEWSVHYILEQGPDAYKP